MTTPPASVPVSAFADADAAAIATAHAALDAVAALRQIDPSSLSANGLLQYVSVLAAGERVYEGAQVAATADVVKRSDRSLGLDGLAARHGCKNSGELIELVTGVAPATAKKRLRVAKHVGPRSSDTGLPLPPLFAQTADALQAGAIGMDVADAITSVLAPVANRCHVEELEYSEALLIEKAVGTEGEMAWSAAMVTRLARELRDRLDPDGVEPRDDELVEKRWLRFTPQANGMLKIAGELAPAQAAIVTPVFDAFMSLRTKPVFLNAEEQAEQDRMKDPRTPQQERSDVFTSMVEGMSRTDLVPHPQGAAPTVMVTVSAEDLRTGSGFGRATGTDLPLPISTVKQFACAGYMQNVFMGDNDEVIALGSKGRFFTATQRKTMIARDGPTCAHPGCRIPAHWAEAHHVVPHSEGGETTVANGVLLCWFHHRLLDRGEWTITMINGRPMFKPPDWLPTRRYIRTVG